MDEELTSNINSNTAAFIVWLAGQVVGRVGVGSKHQNDLQQAPPTAQLSTVISTELRQHYVLWLLSKLSRRRDYVLSGLSCNLVISCQMLFFHMTLSDFGKLDGPLDLFLSQ